MTLTGRQYQYNIISLPDGTNGIDLEVERANYVQALNKKINTLTVITLDGGSLSVRLNANTNDLITLSDGFKIEGIPISTLCWTNSAQVAGTIAEIFTAWVD